MGKEEADETENMVESRRWKQTEEIWTYELLLDETPISIFSLNFHMASRDVYLRLCVVGRVAGWHVEFRLFPSCLWMLPGNLFKFTNVQVREIRSLFYSGTQFRQIVFDANSITLSSADERHGSRQTDFHYKHNPSPSVCKRSAFAYACVTHQKNAPRS